MAMFILLTAGQADQVRGPSLSKTGAALNPIERAGGVFILGVDILADAAHEAHWGELAALPQIDSEDPAFPPSIESEAQ